MELPVGLEDICVVVEEAKLEVEVFVEPIRHLQEVPVDMHVVVEEAKLGAEVYHNQMN